MHLRRYALSGRDRGRRIIRRALLRLAPTIRCERCGRPLFHAFPVISDGGLQLFGAEDITVMVDWSSKRTLRFRHESLHLCRREDDRILTLAELGADHRQARPCC